MLRAIGTTIWLDCPIEICLKRISGDKSRPLLGDEDEMKALLAQRRGAYAQADHSVQAGGLSPEESQLRTEGSHEVLRHVSHHIPQ